MRDFLVAEFCAMYRLVWEFDVRPEHMAEFEKVYGTDGEWVQFFRRSEDFAGTQLYRSVDNPHSFVTVDAWRSRSAYENFRKSYAAEYAAFDQQCERLLRHERMLGVTDDGRS